MHQHRQITKRPPWLCGTAQIPQAQGPGLLATSSPSGQAQDCGPKQMKCLRTMRKAAMGNHRSCLVCSVFVQPSHPSHNSPVMGSAERRHIAKGEGAPWLSGTILALRDVMVGWLSLLKPPAPLLSLPMCLPTPLVTPSNFGNLTWGVGVC